MGDSPTTCRARRDPSDSLFMFTRVRSNLDIHNSSYDTLGGNVMFGYEVSSHSYILMPSPDPMPFFSQGLIYVARLAVRHIKTPLGLQNLCRL
jgi:hypothetical protein